MKVVWIGAALTLSLFAASTAHAAVKVYVNGSGGRIAGGSDDSARDRSGVVASHGYAAIDVPAYSGSSDSWSRVVGCVRDRFAAFDVDIVAQRPASGDYIMAMVGGRPQMLGYPNGIAGVGPFGGRVLGDAIVFAFQTGHRSERGLCETTAHEIGHALGLDHSRLCNDVMSYGSCGAKAFREQDAACGEFSDRPCADGRSKQNSYTRLASLVGLRRDPAPRPTPDPSRPRADPAPRTPQPRMPTAPPQTRGRTPTPAAGTARVAVATSSAQANGVYVIEVRAADSDGIKHVDLLWAQPERTRRLRCGKSDPKLPYTCVRRGDRYIFGLAVGGGERRFAVRVTDGRGHVTQTSAFRETFR